MSRWADDLEADLGWREAELRALRREVVRAGPGATTHQALLRSLCVLLYAHYEGFFRFARGVYLQELQRSGRTRSECKPQIAALSLESQFAGVRTNTSSQELWKFCSVTFPDLLDQPISFRDDQLELSGESNLNPQKLREYCQQLVLQHGTVGEYERELRSLVGRRNHIAHGKKTEVPNLAEYEKLEHVVFTVMHEVAIGVVEALEQQAFLADGVE